MSMPDLLFKHPSAAIQAISSLKWAMKETLFIVHCFNGLKGGISRRKMSLMVMLYSNWEFNLENYITSFDHLIMTIRIIDLDMGLSETKLCSNKYPEGSTRDYSVQENSRSWKKHSI